MADRLTASAITDDQLDQLYAQLDAVRALHANDYGPCYECTGSHGVLWPCPTIRALDGQDTTA